MRWAGLNPGVIAVVGFYAISGYVMTGPDTALLQPRWAESGGFYADRASLAAYYVTALLTAALFVWSGPFPPFLDRVPGPVDALNNMLVIPLNFFMWNGSDQVYCSSQPRSLGCEMLFYLLPVPAAHSVRRLFFGLVSQFSWRHSRDGLRPVMVRLTGCCRACSLSF